MVTILGTESEKDVETRLVLPLFRDILGYPEAELEWGKTIKMPFGRETKTTFADLVANYHGSPVIVVEAKRPTEAVRNGLAQVDSYAHALPTPFSVVTNGRQFVVRGYYSFNSRINVIDESVDDLQNDSWKKVKNLIGFENIPSAMKEPENRVVAPDEVKIQDYRRFFRKIHNEIRDRDKLDPSAAFDELSKLLFLKAAEDEWRLQSKAKPVLSAQMIDEWELLGQGKAKAFVNEWFQVATSELFPDVFGDHPRIELSAGTLRAVLEMMRPFHVKNGDVDVKGRAFEEFLPSQLRGKGLGQFFTPRPVVNFMTELAGISIQDVVVDFSCGSGGFLIKAFDHMRRGVDQLPTGTLSRIGATREKILDDIKSRQIFGVDAEPRAARTAKMNMLMWGDGRRIVRGNALDTKDFLGKPYAPPEYAPGDPDSGCTLILANPPFGSKEKDPSILRRYELSGRNQAREAESTEVLFIEKGLKLLRPEGKMLIVLPQGLLSSTNNQRVRDFIHSEAEIRGIISLPRHTFTPSGVAMVNAVVLYLQKFTAEKRRAYDARTLGLAPERVRNLIRTDPEFDYPIFMGIAENIGYEPSGHVTVKPGEKTDLDFLLDDFSGVGESDSYADIFEFANERYGETTYESVAKPLGRSLKTSFVVNLSETAERLDPPYYLLHHLEKPLLACLSPLGDTIVEKKKRFAPTADAELDAQYEVLTISSDGLVTWNKRVKGEDFKQMKQVRTGDIAYNPMRVNIGSIGVVPAALDGGYVSPDYVVFRSNRVDPDFLVALLRSPFYRLYIDVMTTGSIRDRLYFDNLKAIRVPDPEGPNYTAALPVGVRADEAHDARRKLAVERAETTEKLNAIVRAASSVQGKIGATFRSLANSWKSGRGPSSSVAKMTRHPDYLAIIALGPDVVPFILSELGREPDHWFAALRAITGANPARESDRGNLERLAAAWIEWGKQNGYDHREGLLGMVPQAQGDAS